MADMRKVQWQWAHSQTTAVFQLLYHQGTYITYDLEPPWGAMTIPAAKKIIKALQELVDIAEAKHG